MTKSNKIIIGIIIVVIIIGGIWYGVTREPEEGIIRIGFIGHLSGNYASYSIPMKKAVQLAVEQINEDGGIDGEKIELIFENDNSSAEEAATAMNKLVNIDNVDYIISAQGSGATSAIAPIAQNNKRILMVVLGSAPGITKTGDYIFRSMVSDIYQAVKMNEFINSDSAINKVAGLYVNDAYGVGIRDIIDENDGIQIVADEMFESGASDFKTQLLKIKELDPDVLVLVAHENEYPLILKQIKELGLQIKIIASETFKDENVLAESGSIAEGVYVLFMTESIDYVNFDEEYKERFNESPSGFSKYAYDGVMALIKAIQETESIEEAKNKILGMSFNGASGSVSFDKNGDRIGIEYTVYIVKDGEFIEVE